MVSASKKRTQRILEAAFPLFAQQGLRKTTVEQIASAANMGKGTVYLSFKSKDEILLAILRREAHELFQTLRSAIRKEATAVGQLRAYMQTRVRTIADLFVSHRVSKELRQESRALVEALLNQELSTVERGIIEDILEFGCEQGEFAVADITLASFTIVVTVHALETPWLYEGYEMGLEEKADTLATLMIDGLRRRGTEDSR